MSPLNLVLNESWAAREGRLETQVFPQAFPGAMYDNFNLTQYAASKGGPGNYI